MIKLNVKTLLTAGVLGVGALLTAIAGLFIYVNATATPIHPDAAGVIATADSAPAPAWSAAVEQSRPLARAAIVEQNLPGLSVAVGVGGDLVWAEGFGWADLDARSPVTPRTRFRIGEIASVLTSAAAGLLVEKGVLNLDTEIHTYVPEFPNKRWPITVRQLMAETAGVVTDEGDEAPIGTPCARTLDGLRNFSGDDLLFEPGTRFKPSTYGWVLVSAAIESAARDGFFDVMRNDVFRRIGMEDTRPDSAVQPPPNRATFYFPRFGGDTRYGPEEAREGDHSCWAGGGAFLSTPSDLVRFGLAIANGTLVQPATVAMMQTSERLPSGAETGYGLGWAVESLPLAGASTRMAGHGMKADFIGGSAYLMTFPDRGLVVAVTSNTSFADMKSVASKIADVFAARR